MSNSQEFQRLAAINQKLSSQPFEQPLAEPKVETQSNEHSVRQQKEEEKKIAIPEQEV